MNNFILFLRQKTDLVLGLDESVDVLLPVTGRATLDVVLELSSDTPAAGGVGELEGPQEVGSLLEGRANSVDLVEKVFHRDNTVLAEGSLNNLVVVKGNTLLVDLSVTTLVQQLANSGMVGIAVGNVRFNQSEELLGSLGNSQENTIVNLQKSEKLKSLSGLRCNLVNTLNSNDENELGLRGNIERTIGLSNTLLLNNRALSLVVFFLISTGFLKDNLSLLLGSLE